MQISTKAWMEYIRKMRAISEEAANKMQRYIQLNGFGDDKALLDYAYSLATHYGEAIGALAATMYEATALAQNVIIAPAQLAPTPEYGEVAKAIHGTMKTSNDLVSKTVGRIVKQTGTETTLMNAQRDGAYFAWVPTGSETCPYCIMLAATGWHRAGKKTLRGKYSGHIHANCDCQYAVDFRGDMKIDGYNPGKLDSMISDVFKGEMDADMLLESTWSHGKRNNMQLNQLRRHLRMENKDVINAQKREAYARRKESKAAE